MSPALAAYKAAAGEPAPLEGKYFVVFERANM